MIRIKSFTLIELLVVIAIIGILSSMLLPSLSEAREKGRTAVCASNQKNIAMTTVMYTTDNRDYYYEEWDTYDGISYYESDVYSYDHYGNYQVVYDDLYMEAKDVFKCPSYKNPSEAERFAYSYGMNVYLYDTKTSSIANPDEVLFTVDMNFEWLQPNMSQRVDVRHGTNLAHLWLDGHVSIQKYTGFLNNLQWMKYSLGVQTSWTGEFTLHE